MKQNKRIYEAPAMQVVELKSRQMLLAGSTPDGGIQNIEKQELYSEE